MLITKQFVYGRSKAILSILLLVSSTYSFCMEHGSLPNQRLLGASVEEMDQVFYDAPLLAKKIVTHLNNPIYLKDDSYRYAFLVGESGVGKTTLAKAIAYKTDWKPVFYTPGDLLRKERHATAEHLTKLLNKTVADDVETLVIVDELNQLLENYESKNHDTDATSKALWTFLDKQEGNRKFFFVGTMNRAHKLPPQVKSRILSRCIRMYPPKDGETRKRIFLSKLLSEGVTLTPGAATYVDKNMPKLEGYTGRDFKEFALATKLQAADEEKTDIVVTKDHLKNAAIQIRDTKKFIKYGNEEETDEMRQERHHKESLDLQDQHFVQQQLMNLATILNQKTDYYTQYDVMTKSYIINCTKQNMTQANMQDVLSYLTPEQWFHYLKVQEHRKRMQETLKEAKQREQEAKKQEGGLCSIM